MTTKYFYQNMQSFSHFVDVTEDHYYKPVPDDWFIIITDIKSSTQAIDNGQYKSVNVIGAAAIVSANNVMEGLEFPSIFGGDGAVLLIPSEYRLAVEHKLSALQELSQKRFGLELRIGVISVRDILTEGAKVEVAKFSLIGKQNIACIRGGGISLAEKKIKEEETYWINHPSANSTTNLHRLSCRWETITPKKGMVLTILVRKKTKKDFSVYKKFFDVLKHIYGSNLDDANPVNLSKFSYRNLKQCLLFEKGLHHSSFSIGFFKRIHAILASSFIFRFGLLKHYRNSIRIHSDYRKFDDMLRMVIDCSPSQAKLIHGFLTYFHQKGEINFGLHLSKKALMTCFVDGIGSGQHIHFIDGHNGGYALAARNLKNQMQKE